MKKRITYQPYQLPACRALLVLLMSFLLGSVSAQPDNGFEEVPVTINVQRVGSTELNAVIHEQTIYLPVKELFDFLKIRNTGGIDSVYGFIADPRSSYVVDKLHQRIICMDKNFSLTAMDLIKTNTGLYLRSELFGSIFGLDCAFNFRSLSVGLTSRIELPAIREMQQEEMRKNMIRLKGEKKADTLVKRKFEMFRLGTADWAITNIRERGNTNTRLNLNLGGIVAGGETNVYLNYNNLLPFKWEQQFFRWRYVNNEKPLLRQATAGNLFVQPTSSVYGAIHGVQFTNTPTTFRRSFGTYRLSNNTKPGWTVELYVNNVLVNYTRADASGFYSFDVPLVYGNSEVKLKFYGPWGEEETEEKSIGIPFNFLPVKDFEYNITAGIINDEDKSRFSRLNFNYGVSNHITVGGGLEYNSSVTSGAAMPYLTTSLRLGNNMLVSGEYTYGVKVKALLNYHLPSNLQFEASYIKYEEGQTAIKPGKLSFNNYLSEKKATVSMPIRSKKFAAFSRLTFSQLELTNMKYTTGEFLITAIYCGMNTNFTTSTVYSDPRHPLIYSTLSNTFRLPKGMRLTPQVQYEHTSNMFSLVKCELEKNLFNRGFLNFTWENNLAHHTNYMGVGIRYNFSFAQTSATVAQNSDITSFVQSARGSLLFNDRTSQFTVDNQSNLGRGGLMVIPFLDLNNNGHRDKNEPKISGLKLRVNGGKMKYNKDSTITVYGLEAYNNYLLEFNRNSFDNIAWHLYKQSYSVTIEPNHFKQLEVPVVIAGEVSGMVFLKDKGDQKGLGRILVNIFRDSVLVTKLLSEPDGFFTYLGLSPGMYTVAIDTAQLSKLDMIASAPVTFQVHESKDGDVKDGLQFVCQKLSAACPVDKNGIRKDSDKDGVPDCIDKELITLPSCFPVDAEGVGKCNSKTLIQR